MCVCEGVGEDVKVMLWGLFGLLFFCSVRGVYSLLCVSVCRVESVSCHVYPLPIP